MLPVLVWAVAGLHVDCFDFAIMAAAVALAKCSEREEILRNSDEKAVAMATQRNEATES